MTIEGPAEKYYHWLKDMNFSDEVAAEMTIRQQEKWDIQVREAEKRTAVNEGTIYRSKVAIQYGDLYTWIGAAFVCIFSTSSILTDTPSYILSVMNLVGSCLLAIGAYRSRYVPFTAMNLYLIILGLVSFIVTSPW